MCDQLVSFAEFRAILTPFSEVIRKAVTEIIGRPVTMVNSIHRLPDLTPQIVFSSTGKVPNCNKNNSAIKPNKFHSKYVCFGGRKTRDERKLCLKIHLFGFPQRLVTGQSTTETRKMVSPSTLIGPFEFDRALATRPLLTCDRELLFLLIAIRDFSC